MNFEHWDASGLSYRSTLNTGTAIMGEGGEGSPAELDPFGSNVGLFTPYIELTASPFEPEYPSLQLLSEDMPMYVNGQMVTATLDGVSVPLGMALGMLANGSAAQCPNNNCGSQVFTNSAGQTVISSPFMAYANGTSGFWIDENDPNSPAPPPGVIDGGGVRTRLVEVPTSTVSWLLIGFKQQSSIQPVKNPVPPETPEDKFRRCGGSNSNDWNWKTAAALLTLAGSPEKASMLWAIWGRESNFILRGDGDHGPMQLGGWWYKNHRNLFVAGARDSFDRPPAPHPNRKREFGGSLSANFETGLNIINFSLNRYNQSFFDTAYHYGPGELDDPTGYNAASKEKRKRYANDVVGNYNNSIGFFKCFNEGVVYAIGFDIL